MRRTNSAEPWRVRRAIRDVRPTLWTCAAAVLIAITLLAGASPASFAAPAVQGAPPTCNSIIPVFQDAINNCSRINNDYACYGTYNTRGDAVGRPSEKLRFKIPEDRAPIERFQSLATLPYKNTYGAAVMRLTAPGAGQPVTALLFGDAQLAPGASAAGRVFTLNTAGTEPVCTATPAGLAVRVTSGKTGRITINGIEITLGSTAYLTTPSATQTVLANLEGNVAARLPSINARVVIPRGFQTVITVQNGTAVAFTQPAPSAFASSVLLQWITTRGLPQVLDPNTEPVAQEPRCGGTIAFGQSITQQNSVPGQECIYNFCANAGDVATVAVQRVRGNLDPYVDLRNADRSLLRWNDDTAASNTNSLICNQPLPVTSCDYTIVARPSGNDSSGAFRVTLNGQSTCQPPPPNCEVTPETGLDLRSGPGAQFNRVSLLAAGVKLFRLAGSLGDPWVQVQVAPNGPTGWVTGDAESLYCEDETAPAQTGPAPSTGGGGSSGSPTGSTGGDNGPQTSQKAGPFPAP